MIIMIDNYDSFTYNLVQYFGELGEVLRVFRNDKISVGEIEKLRPEKIVISPGPGRPEDAGISCEIIKRFSSRIPILGVCLGHQCLGYVFGAKVVRAKKLMHGKTSMIRHNGKGLFKGMPDPFSATRYHSLLVDNKDLPKDLEITAWTQDQEIMGLKHRGYPAWGVQFHPESIMSQDGRKILANFLKI
jgi:anthranilate synthase component II